MESKRLVSAWEWFVLFGLLQAILFFFFFSSGDNDTIKLRTTNYVLWVSALGGLVEAFILRRIINPLWLYASKMIACILVILAFRIIPFSSGLVFFLPLPLAFAQMVVLTRAVKRAYLWVICHWAGFVLSFMTFTLAIGIVTSVLSTENQLLPKVFMSLIPFILYPLMVWFCIKNFNQQLKIK